MTVAPTDSDNYYSYFTMSLTDSAEFAFPGLDTMTTFEQAVELYSNSKSAMVCTCVQDEGNTAPFSPIIFGLRRGWTRYLLHFFQQCALMCALVQYVRSLSVHTRKKIPKQNRQIQL